MATETVRPILQRGRLNRSRNYGRYDFERFDNLSSTHASIGHSTFDKVNVNCRFLFKKSRWGVLGEQKNPAGIIFLDLSFDQPKDSQLHSAMVIITLDDEDEDLLDVSRNYNVLNKRPQCPVQMTDCYGPKGFSGEAKTIHTKKSLHLTPNAQFAGSGFGGLGVDHVSSFTSSSRWRFSGTLLPGKDRHWAYKALKWDLSENDLETQATHSNVIHTAFTFEHSGQPFFMKVDETPSHVKKDDGAIVTMVTFGDKISFKTPLDERAQQLQFEMELANMHAIPMEVPDPKPATFFNFLQNSGKANIPIVQRPLQSSTGPQSSLSSSVQDQLPSSIQPQLLQGSENISSVEDTTNATIANLAQAFEDLQRVDQGTFQQVRSPLSSSKIVVTEGTRFLPANTDISNTNDQQQEDSEQQMILCLLRMPAILTLLRLITALLGLFNQKRSSRTEDEGDTPCLTTPTRKSLELANQVETGWPSPSLEKSAGAKHDFLQAETSGWIHEPSSAETAEMLRSTPVQPYRKDKSKMTVIEQTQDWRSGTRHLRLERYDLERERDKMERSQLLDMERDIKRRRDLTEKITAFDAERQQEEYIQREEYRRLVAIEDQERREARMRERIRAQEDAVRQRRAVPTPHDPEQRAEDSGYGLGW
ncbi:uncharacterized protein LY89DRAFT_725429 [Mollisia scopiformis]|uniref:Uncharacterized protein n=1 Tax=Mollisia scopiformis TaxID=149040 RepID=A0A132B8C0_MOLSC|nr:uncharacterized protein LY89DRAFT_725429 [Mollisia scopiformis]KUJ08124.1 hypothetical protein LY89DRAFT_725429 [Mollisia scopiformis]